jgi:hypothetical protein
MYNITLNMITIANTIQLNQCMLFFKNLFHQFDCPMCILYIWLVFKFNNLIMAAGKFAIQKAPN